MNLKRRLGKVKNVVLKKPYIFLFFGFAIAYIVINILANKIYITKDVLFYNLGFGIPYIIFTLLVAVLIAINLNLMIVKFKEMKTFGNMRKESGLTSMGILGGLVAGACPGCFIGIFPALLGIFGISASLSIFPFYGLEIQALSALLLIGSIFLLTKEPTCSI